MIRQKLIFYGRVQGVGFRYRARYAALDLDLTGWVKNNYDGSVEMEVQGERENITKMIQSISKGRFLKVTGLDRTDIPLKEDERDFRVEYY